MQGGTTFTDDRTVTVEVGKAADTATEGTDYTTVAAQTITIPAGTASAHVDFTLTPTDDGLDEATETVTLTGTAAGTTVDGTSITINDDDTRGVTVVPTSLTLRETDDPATTEAEENSGTYTVRLDSEPTGNVVIDLAIPDGAPFTATPTSLTFTPSGTGIWSTGQAVTITAANDDLDNAGDRRQAVITHDLKAGSSDYGGVTVENVTVAVTDDDGAVSFAIADASATEGGAVTFTVSRAGATGGTATVSWNTSSDGDGDHPASTSDYTPQTTAQSLSFASGETSRTFTVQTTQDQIDEENETFLVILSAPGAGTSISDGTAIGTITDDDGAPTDYCPHGRCRHRNRRGPDRPRRGWRGQDRPPDRHGAGRHDLHR
ncbi:MAG: hypothetical protein OXI62_08495 [Chloroflexota bacterium]|nr:hypothetical protein [Chloroflexota bacterium]